MYIASYEIRFLRYILPLTIVAYLDLFSRTLLTKPPHTQVRRTDLKPQFNYLIIFVVVSFSSSPIRN